MLRRMFIAGLLALAGLLAPPARAEAPQAPHARELRDVIGVCHINGFYNFPQKDTDYLNEGADQVLALGSRVVKVVIRDRLEGYYPFDKWPAITSLVQAAQLPPYQKLFAKPFKTYVLMSFTPGREIHYFTEGMTPADVKREQDSYYALTKYLLTKYRGTGKTFILQNWEGDWVLTPPPPDLIKRPTDKAIQGMIDWLNARQDGVDRARREVGMHGVTVAHAAEVNLLEKALLGLPCVTNSVLPRTHCDLYSYSAYNTLVLGREKFRQSLDYLAQQAPNSKLYGSHNIYLGEFGWPESVVGEEKRLAMMKDTVEVALEFGVRYALFWELYDDGPTRKYTGRPKNADMIGNWLIRPDGTRSLLWDYFGELFKPTGSSPARQTAEVSHVQ